MAGKDNDTSVYEKMTAIADAIRVKTGITEKLGLDAMASGVAEVYEAGKQAEYDTFWNIHQDNGERTNYDNAFYYWRPGMLYPKYDMIPTRMNRMFYGMTRALEYIDLRQRFIDCGVTLDTSQCTSIKYAFSNSYITCIPVIDATSCIEELTNVFTAVPVHTIEKLIVVETNTFSRDCFKTGTLENIVIEGTIGNSVSFSYCTNLTHDSLMSIINALKDFSGTSTTMTLTLGDDNLAKLTDAEKAIATSRGWTLA